MWRMGAFEHIWLLQLCVYECDGFVKGWLLWWSCRKHPKFPNISKILLDVVSASSYHFFLLFLGRKQNVGFNFTLKFVGKVHYSF
jgi:hypothetical protein